MACHEWEASYSHYLLWLHTVVDLGHHSWNGHASLGQLEEILLYTAGYLGVGVRGGVECEGRDGVCGM